MLTSQLISGRDISMPIFSHQPDQVLTQFAVIQKFRSFIQQQTPLSRGGIAILSLVRNLNKPLLDTTLWIN